MKYFSVITLVSAVPQDPGYRSFVSQTQISSLRLDESHYGCWCRFPNYAETNPRNAVIPNGSGQPVDEIDKSCQTLSRGYNCLRKDYPDCDIFGVERDNINDKKYEGPSVSFRQ